MKTDISILGRAVLVVAAFAIFAAAIPGSAYAGGNLNFFLGSKSLDEYDWAPLDEHSEFGIKADFEVEGSGVNLAVDLFRSSDKISEFGASLEGSTSELAFGVRMIQEAGNMHSFFGGGLALVSAEWELCTWTCDSTSDSAIGPWLDAGVYWTLNQRLNLGMNLRWSKATVELGGWDIEAGGTHFGILAGIPF